MRLALESAECDRACLVTCQSGIAATSDWSSALSCGNSLRREIDPELSTISDRLIGHESLAAPWRDGLDVDRLHDRGSTGDGEQAGGEREAGRSSTHGFLLDGGPTIAALPEPVPRAGEPPGYFSDLARIQDFRAGESIGASSTCGDARQNRACGYCAGFPNNASSDPRRAFGRRRTFPFVSTAACSVAPVATISPATRST